MSRFRVVAPAKSPTAVASPSRDREPVVLSFRLHSEAIRRERSRDPLQRARLLSRNSLCPRCRHPVVEPLELGDALPGKNRQPVPGTATLAGFHCQGCHAEWAA